MQIFPPSQTQRAPAIRLINLVDVLFILLIFFVATTTFREALPTAVKLELPEAKTAEELGKEKLERMVISVGADEQIHLGNQSVDLPALETALREAKRKNANVIIQFSADKKVRYGTVVAIVDAAQAAGIRNLTAFTKKSVK